MPATRPRRIFIRGVMLVAVTVLLLSGYVGAYLALNWCVGRRVVSWSTFDPLVERVFHPLSEYRYSGWPGSRALIVMQHLCYSRGRGENMTWKEADAAVWDEDYQSPDPSNGASAWQCTP